MKIPLQVPRVGEPFPQLLGLPLIDSVVNELEKNIQAPRPIIFSAILSAISLVLQGLVDVRKPKGGVTPCSLMLLCIADSGERKSTVDKVVMRAVREIQNKMDREYGIKYSKWEGSLEIWETKQKAIQSKIGRLAARGEAFDDLEAQYLDGFAAQPMRPKKFKMLYDDTTSEALFWGLHQDLLTAGMITSEGRGVLRGPALNDLSKQNSLWSGDSICVDRRLRGGFTLEGARLTVSMMVQSAVFNKYMQDHGDESRGSGLWARFLVCRPESTQGQRFIRIGDVPAGCSEFFNSKLEEFVYRNITCLESGEWGRQVLEFDDAAKERWVELFNFVEQGMAEGGFWGDAKDHASKLADNIARMAALFHCFEGGEKGEAISEASLDAAARVGFWYSSEFVKVFSRAGQLEGDSAELSKWLAARVAKNGSSFSKNNILRYGPNRLRSKAVLDGVLDYLQGKGVVGIEYTSRGCYVTLYPPGRFRDIGVVASIGRRF